MTSYQFKGVISSIVIARMPFEPATGN